MTREATAQYLDRIGQDCATVLGPDSVVLSVEHAEHDRAVRPVVRYDVRGTVHVTAATGETIVAAHTALRRQLVHDRLEIAFTAVINSS